MGLAINSLCIYIINDRMNKPFYFSKFIAIGITILCSSR